jgi:hypothetical protein
VEQTCALMSEICTRLQFGFRYGKYETFSEIFTIEEKNSRENSKKCKSSYKFYDINAYRKIQKGCIYVICMYSV